MAKHAKWGGGMHPEDGNHAIYHHEVRQTLEGLGLNLTLGDSYDMLFTRPPVDFVFPLLNRGGFVNSEMLIPLLLATASACPISVPCRSCAGWAMTSRCRNWFARHAGVPTADWFCYRRGAPVLETDLPASPAGRWVIKPNASSASWGISDALRFLPGSPTPSPISTGRAMMRSWGALSRWL